MDKLLQIKGSHCFPGFFFFFFFLKFKHHIKNALNQHQIVRKAYQGSKWLNKVDIFPNPKLKILDYLTCLCKNAI